MGKKKPTTKTNNSSIVASIGYQGEVKLDIERNGKLVKSNTIKNMGTNLLFQQLCLALANRPFHIPNFLGVGASSDILPATANNLKAPYTSIPRSTLTSPSVTLNTNGGYNVSWTTSLSYNALGHSSIREFGLFLETTGTNMVARITTPEVTLSQGEVLIVTWTMNINNV